MDILGLVVAVVVLAASAHENTAGIALLDRVAADTSTVSRALVDQGIKNSVVAYGATVGIDVQVVERQALACEAGQAQAQIDELTDRLRELNEAISDL